MSRSTRTNDGPSRPQRRSDRATDSGDTADDVDGRTRGRHKLAAPELDPFLDAVAPERAATHPDVPARIAVAEAKKIASIARRHQKALASLPYFHEGRVSELRSLGRALRGAERQVARTKRQFGGRELVAARRRAEVWRADALASARWVLRDAEALDTLSTVPVTDLVDDLVRALDALVGVIGSRANLFAALPDRVDIGTGIALAAALRGAVDTPLCVVAIDTRNRAHWALEAASAEVRAALAFVLRDDRKKLAALATRHERASH